MPKRKHRRAGGYGRELALSEPRIKTPAFIRFGFEESTRSFTIQPHGDNAERLCRSISCIEKDRSLNLFRLQEMFWPELSKFCDAILDGTHPSVLQEFLRRACPPSTPIPAETPTGQKLRDYQQRGSGVLVHNKCAVLADDMGLGKTPQALQAFSILRQQGKVRGMIVVCPSSVAGQWDEQAKFFLGEGAFILEHNNLAECPEEGIVVLSYGKVYREHYQEVIFRLLRKKGWVVCMDEAHRCGAVGSSQYHGLSIMMDGQEYRWALTGTEVRNQPDSWLTLYVLVMGAKVDRARFCAYYQTAGKWDIHKLRSISQVRNQFGLRRVQEDVLGELPPLTEILHEIPASADQLKLLAQVEQGETILREFADGGADLIENNGRMSEMIRMFQICSHPMLVGGDEYADSPKWPTVRDILTDRGDQQILIWSYYPDVIAWLAKKIEKEGLRVGSVHGSVARAKRDEIRLKLDAGELDVLIANPQAFAEGVNLQAASINIYWDESWSKHLWEQSRKRSHRMGQQRPVTIHYLRHPKTIETTAYDWIREKQDLAKAMTGEL